MAKRSEQATLKVVGEADFSKIEQGIAKLDAKLNQVSKAQKGLGSETSKSEKSMLQFAKGAQLAIAGLATSQVVKFTAEMVQLDAAIDATTNRLDFMTDGKADLYVRRLAEESGYLIDEQSALQVSLKLVGLQLVDNEEQAAQLATKIAVLGQTFKGVDAGQAADEFALMMANMSIPRLDSFGLSASKVKARIDELMASTAGMTKEAAFQQAVMEELDNAYNRVGGQAAGTANDMGVLKAAFADLKVEVAGLVSEAFEPSISMAAKLVRGYRDMKTAIGDFKSATASTTGTFEEYVQALYDAGQVNATINDSVQLGTYAAMGLSKQVGKLADEYWNLRQAEAAAAGANPTDVWAQAIPVLEDSSEATQVNTMTLEEQEQALREAEQAHREYIQGLREQHNAQLDLIKSSASHIETMAQLNMYYGEGYGELQRNQQIGQQWLDLLASTGNEYRLTGGALNEYLVQQGLASEESIRLAGAQQEVVAAMEAGRVSAEEAAAIFADVMSGQATDVEAAVAAQEAHNEVMAQATGILDEMRGTDIGETFAEAQEPAASFAEQLGLSAEAAAAMSEQIPLAFESLAEVAPGANEALQPVALALQNSEAYIKGMIASAPDWAAAMNEAGAAIATEGSGTSQAASQLEGMRKAWEYLVLNPRIALEAVVSFATTGGIPGAAGGADFIATRPMMLPVGELGLPEQVTVKPLYNSSGIPKFNPSKGIGMAAGGSLTYPGSGGGGGTTINNLNVTLPGVRNARDFLPELLRELKNQGMYIPEKRIAV